MNPDPNQPVQPAQPVDPQQPSQEPVQYPVPETPSPEVSVPQAPAEPTPTTDAPAPAANPFGGSAPVSSDAPVASPFAQPAAAIGSSPNSNPTPNFGGNPKKKQIILISAIVGGVIALIGVALAVYFIFFSVTKADYKQAYDQLKTIQSSVSNSSISGEPGSLTTAFNEFKTENAKLGNLKALRADSELNAKYKVYNDKAKAYITFMDAFIPSYEKLATVTSSLSSGSLLKSSSVQATITALEAASDASDPTIKAYVDSLLAAYKEILPQVKIYESSSSSSERLKAITAISASSKGLSSATLSFSKDLKDRYEAVSPKEAFDDLSSAVTKKYNQK